LDGLTSEIFNVDARYHGSKVYGGTLTGGHGFNCDFLSSDGHLELEQLDLSAMNMSILMLYVCSIC